jgi:hypothetical protein
MSLSDAFWQEQLRVLGYSNIEQLAIGMQGVVFRLDGGRVAKIWFHAGEPELRTLGELYRAIDGRLPYRTPRMLELQRPGPYWVTVEEELPGVPLHTVAAAYGEMFAARLGYDAVQLLVYRCAYSLIIANAHDQDPYGRDSHVRLTAGLFNTPEVTALLTR